jgi:hypothetical protein
MRTVIQGASDMGKRLSEEEIQRSMDFCVGLFPVSGDDDGRASAAALEMVDVRSALGHRVVSPQCERSVTEHDENDDKSRKATKAHARRLVATEFEMSNFETEPLDGCVVRLVRGRLGLVRV